MKARIAVTRPSVRLTTQSALTCTTLRAGLEGAEVIPQAVELMKPGPTTNEANYAEIWARSLTKDSKGSACTLSMVISTVRLTMNGEGLLGKTVTGMSARIW